MTKLKKSLKNFLNSCKMQIVFKNKTRLDTNFYFKDGISKDLTSGVVRLWNKSNYGNRVRRFNIRIGEPIGLSPHTKKNKLSLIAALSPLIYYFATIQHSMTILVFYHMRTKSLY